MYCVCNIHAILPTFCDYSIKQQLIKAVHKAILHVKVFRKFTNPPTIDTPTPSTCIMKERQFIIPLTSKRTNLRENITCNLTCN